MKKPTHTKIFPTSQGFKILVCFFFLTNCASTLSQNDSYAFKNFDSENLVTAVKSGNHFFVESVLNSGANVNTTTSDPERFSILMLSVIEGDERMVELILKHGPNINQQTRDGHTALMQACNLRYPKIVKLLLNAGADPNIKSLGGHTAFSEITRSESLEITQLLKAKGVRE